MTLEQQVHDLEVRLRKAEASIKYLLDLKKQELVELATEEKRRQDIDEISHEEL